MKAWDIYPCEFPDLEPHPAVVLGVEARLANKPRVNALFCSSKRPTRQAEVTEVVLDEADGLDWPALCKCDLVVALNKSQLTRKRGSVSVPRRRQIAERVIRGLGLAGL